MLITREERGREQMVPEVKEFLTFVYQKRRHLGHHPFLSSKKRETCFFFNPFICTNSVQLSVWVNTQADRPLTFAL